MEVKMFKTPDCTVCPDQRDRLEELLDRYPDVDFSVVDVTENREEANKYHIRSAPTTIVESGDGVSSFSGLTEKSEIEKVIQ